MHALPFLLALLSGAILAPAVLRTLGEGGHTQPNYRDRPLPFPFGVLIVAAALIALIPLVLLGRRAGHGNAKGRGLAWPGTVRDELRGPLQAPMALGGRRARAGDERLQPARSAPQIGRASCRERELVSVIQDA